MVKEMKNKFLILAIAALSSLAAISANAATYTFNESYAFTNFTSLGGGLYSDHYLLVDGSALTLDSQTYSSVLDNETKYSGTSNFILTTKTGDQLFGGSTLTSVSGSSVLFNTFYTGGTGLFLSATGTGEWAMSFDNSTLVNTATINTAAVPESDTSTMLLMGAGLMGFISRRRKQTTA